MTVSVLHGRSHEAGQYLRSTMRPQIEHYGNIANNAFFNRMILTDAHVADSSKIISGVTHALSAPAWEVLEFEVPSPDFVDHPNWKQIPQARAINNASVEEIDQDSRAWDFSVILRHGVQALRRIPGGRSTPLRAWAGRRLDALEGELRRARLGLRQKHTAHSTTSSPSRPRIQILYGPPAYMFKRRPDAALVLFEHGTLRWIDKGSESDAMQRSQYLDLVRAADHVLVTNLDLPSVAVADRVCAGRWSAFPHPYVFDPNAPYPYDDELGRHLRAVTKSSHIVLLPSSMNWKPDHDKGSMKALEAFVHMRREGEPVGLVATAWGRQVQEAKEFLDRSGVAQHVLWIDPRPRIRLQRLMACVDVVWDQFRYATIGALALRCMEQGTPLISCHMDPTVGQLMGEAPPLLQATETQDIAETSARVIHAVSRDGLGGVHDEYRATSRSWLMRRHSPDIAVVLQAELFQSLGGGQQSVDRSRSSWAQVPDVGTAEFSRRLAGLGLVSDQQAGVS